jgi:hypothetical protein
MADVTKVPDFDEDQEWDPRRDWESDGGRDWDWRRDRDYDRAPEEWRDRPRRRSEPVWFLPEQELPRKVQHIRRFIHRLLPF